MDEEEARQHQHGMGRSGLQGLVLEGLAVGVLGHWECIAFGRNVVAGRIVQMGLAPASVGEGARGGTKRLHWDGF